MTTDTAQQIAQDYRDRYYTANAYGRELIVEELINRIAPLVARAEAADRLAEAGVKMNVVATDTIEEECPFCGRDDGQHHSNCAGAEWEIALAAYRALAAEGKVQG